jgi:uncharacterized damage-inducible protein DinB
MNPIPRWFDRQFEFNFPPEQHANLCVRLRGTPARLEEMVRCCRRETLVRKQPGKWSAQEHAGHLVDLEVLWLERVNDFLSGKSELTAADLRNRKTHEADHNARALQNILAEFRTARTQLVDRVETIERTVLARAMLHPRLKKPMRILDHLYFAAEHDDHHLAHIWEMIRS